MGKIMDNSTSQKKRKNRLIKIQTSGTFALYGLNFTSYKTILIRYARVSFYGCSAATIHSVMNPESTRAR